MTDYNGILVCTDTAGGKLAGIAAELLGAGARLSADMEQPLTALVVGAGPDSEAAKQAISMGAVKVVAVPSSDLNPEQYALVLEQFCSSSHPAVIMMAHDDTGRDGAPRLAAKIGAVVTMDCTGVEIDPSTRELLLSKPVYGGNALAVWASSSFPEVITVRPGSFQAAQADAGKSGEVTSLDVSAAGLTPRTRLIEATKAEGVKLEDAKVIVAGGAGLGTPDGLKMIEELAGLLGGVVGVTRVPCDLGWVPISMEIGQTGHIVAPELYIAVGISGAPQHVTGCLGSKVIVAINRDPDANIFKMSNFGVVGDYKQILPSFAERVKALKG